MGYPLVPGYESVGVVSQAGAASGLSEGEMVFVPGAKCFGDDVRCLFGGSARKLVVPGARVISLYSGLAEQGALMALAATAQHAIGEHAVPDLIVCHGVLGRLLARLTLAHGQPAPVVWETNPMRRSGAEGYAVIDPSEDARKDYRAIYDVSGAKGLLNDLISRLVPMGEVVLAGFYEEPLSFDFPAAFMREARIRVAAQWQATDSATVKRLVEAGQLSLGGLITHTQDAANANDAYRTAFEDASCLKMILDWRAF